MGLIFRQKEPIRDRTKTKTRRIVKQNEVGGSWDADDRNKIYSVVTRIGSSISSSPTRRKWAVGRTYAAVPKRGEKRFGNIKITSIRLERLQRITEEEARAEGVGSIEEYKVLWESINGKTRGARWDDNPLVWVIGFKYLGDA